MSYVSRLLESIEWAEGRVLKQPFEMTFEEFAKNPYSYEGGIQPSKPGYVVVYHKLRSNDDIPSVLEHGLDPKRRQRGAEGPTIMASSDPEGYSQYGALIAVQVPEDTPKDRVGQVDHFYYLYNAVPPEDILFVDPIPEGSVATTGRRLSFYRDNRYAEEYWKYFIKDALERGDVVPEIVKHEYDQVLDADS